MPYTVVDCFALCAKMLEFRKKPSEPLLPVQLIVQQMNMILIFYSHLYVITCSFIDFMEQRICKLIVSSCLLQRCSPRVAPSQPEEHYKAVCRALATESNELRIFLTKVFTDDAEALRIKADAQTSRQELGKLHFSDWVRIIF